MKFLNLLYSPGTCLLRLGGLALPCSPKCISGHSGNWEHKQELLPHPWSYLSDVFCANPLRREGTVIRRLCVAACVSYIYMLATSVRKHTPRCGHSRSTPENPWQKEVFEQAGISMCYYEAFLSSGESSGFHFQARMRTAAFLYKVNIGGNRSSSYEAESACSGRQKLTRGRY